MTWALIAIGIAILFAVNIGASGAAATMGPAYGSGAVSKKSALLLAAMGTFLGAILGSGEVVKTIGQGIITPNLLTAQIVIVILASAAFTLLAANLMGIPLSTSEVTVGAVVGVGVAFQSVYTITILKIVLFWLIIPLVAFIIAYIQSKWIRYIECRFPALTKHWKWGTVLKIIVILTGCIEAFSAGMNNVANAIGPIIGANIISTSSGTWLGAFFVAIGAMVLGGKVLETNGKKITNLSLLQSSMVSGTGGGLVMIASILGMPVPLTQITTSAILGVGVAEHGVRMWQKSIMIKILKVWTVSPVLSLVVSYSLIHLFIKPDIYKIIAVLGVLIATIMTMNLYQQIRREKSQIHDEGSGI